MTDVEVKAMISGTVGELLGTIITRKTAVIKHRNDNYCISYLILVSRYTRGLCMVLSQLCRQQPDKSSCNKDGGILLIGLDQLQYKSRFDQFQFLSY